MPELNNKAAIVSVYIPDERILEEMKRRSAKEDRSLSSWMYLALKKAALEEEENKKI